ncbi:hypothetical protein HAX54_011086, partial [Datura stramonium]|nr:hypothetical protein [Datura stramonium]
NDEEYANDGDEDSSESSSHFDEESSSETEYEETREATLSTPTAQFVDDAALLCFNHGGTVELTAQGRSTQLQASSSSILSSSVYVPHKSQRVLAYVNEELETEIFPRAGHSMSVLPFPNTLTRLMKSQGPPLRPMIGQASLLMLPIILQSLSNSVVTIDAKVNSLTKAALPTTRQMNEIFAALRDLEYGQKLLMKGQKKQDRDLDEADEDRLMAMYTGRVSCDVPQGIGTGTTSASVSTPVVEPHGGGQTTHQP